MGSTKSKFKNCKKGYACGGGCVNVTYDCHKDFPEGVSVPIDFMTKQISEKIKSSPKPGHRKISDINEKKDIKTQAKELAAKKVKAKAEAEAEVETQKETPEQATARRTKELGEKLKRERLKDEIRLKDELENEKKRIQSLDPEQANAQIAKIRENIKRLSISDDVKSKFAKDLDDLEAKMKSTPVKKKEDEEFDPIKALKKEAEEIKKKKALASAPAPAPTKAKAKVTTSEKAPTSQKSKKPRDVSSLTERDTTGKINTQVKGIKREAKSELEKISEISNVKYERGVYSTKFKTQDGKTGELRFFSPNRDWKKTGRLRTGAWRANSEILMQIDGQMTPITVFSKRTTGKGTGTDPKYEALKEKSEQVWKELING